HATAALPQGLVISVVLIGPFAPSQQARESAGRPEIALSARLARQETRRIVLMPATFELGIVPAVFVVLPGSFGLPRQVRESVCHAGTGFSVRSTRQETRRIVLTPAVFGLGTNPLVSFVLPGPFGPLLPARESGRHQGTVLSAPSAERRTRYIALRRAAFELLKAPQAGAALFVPFGPPRQGRESVGRQGIASLTRATGRATPHIALRRAISGLRITPRVCSAPPLL